MAWLVELALILVALGGHFSITVWLFNRLHALAMPRWLLKALERLLLAASGALVCVVTGRWLVGGFGLLPAAGELTPAAAEFLAYGLVMWAAAAAIVPCWLMPKLL